jgi:type VI secretion system protein VasJ
MGVAPIPGDIPCGIAVRYEPEFEKLDAEIGKQESLNAESVNWSVVVDLGTTILSNKSKDLLVASYLTRGLFETESYAGLAAGLKIINALIENFWDGMFPPLKRRRARATPLQWLAEKITPGVEAAEPTAEQAAAVIECVEMLRAIDSELGERLEDDAPSLADLLRPLKRYKQIADQQTTPPPAAPEPTPAEVSAAPAAAEPVAQPAAAEPAAETPAPTATPAPAPPPPPRADKVAAPAAAAVGKVESDADAKKALRQIQGQIRDVATYWLQSKSSDARAYRLARTAAWMMVDTIPPNTDGTTQVPAPAAERVKHFVSQLEEGKHEEVLVDMEKMLSRTPFWLDGQRMVATACSTIGGSFKEAGNAVTSEVEKLLRRLPELAELKFADGTPFADEQTHLWLETQVLAAPDEGGGDGGSAAGADDADLLEAIKGAREEVMRNDTGAAVRRFEAGADAAAGERNRFKWRMAMAEMLQSAGQSDVAIPILEYLAEQIERHGLDAWEPSLSARCYALLHAGYQKRASGKDAQESPEFKVRMDLAFAKLCRLNPSMVIKSKGKGEK